MRTIRHLARVGLLIALLGAGAVTAAHAQTGTIQGTVYDAEGVPLPGVNVVVEGTQTGSSTGADGAYPIDLEAGSYTLEASSVGYETAAQEDVEVAAGETTVVDFTLQESEVALDEVVVIGYGEQERRDLTGSVASVEGEEISRFPTSSVTQALQGQVAGVQVTPSSGGPGAGAVVRIRGVGTLGDASPLYVVDGMLTDDISFLNPQDVASIDVLKDASATAIYGSRGANGVIIVTTKHGRRGAGTDFNFNAYYGWQEVMDPIDLAGPREYALLANEVVRNEQGPDAELPFEEPQSISQGTNWQDLAFRTSPIQSYQLSARGGGERIAYNLSGNYFREKGVVQKSDFQRASLRLNSDYALTDAVAVGHNLAFTYRTGTSAPPGIISQVYRADPVIAPRDAEGDFINAGVRASAGNPAASIFYHRNAYSGSRFLGNLFVEADVLDAFTLRSSFGLDLDRQTTRNFSPVFFVSPAQQNPQSSINVGEAEQNSWLWENTLDYTQRFGNHEVEAVTGLTFQEFTQESLGGRRVDVIGESRSLWYLGTGGPEGQTNFNAASDWSMISYLFRINYSYLGRYLLTVTGRADGSSRFRAGNRFGYFPSAAVGWRIVDEPFMEDVGGVSDLKLRASWGRIGNDRIGPYPGIPVVDINQGAIFGTPGSISLGATPIELANPNVEWETTTQTDVALEMGFFDQRLTAEVDYYHRVTDGILVRVPIPDYVGVNVEPYVNAAEVLNTGFDLNLNWRGTAGDFTYRLGAVGSTVRNEVLSLGQGRQEIFAGGLGNEISFTTKTVVGQPIGSFFGYRVAGVYQNEQEIEALPAPPGGGVQPGDLRFADLNDDGEITPDDRTFIGSPIPDFIYGFSLNLGWRGFDLVADVSGQVGNQVFNAKKGTRFGIENFEASFLDRWHGEGTSTTEPRVTNAGWNYQVSEWYLTDGDYLKLRNLRLGYTLPGRWMGTLGVSQAQVYVNGANLFTLTGYSGYTPEIASENVLASGLDTGVYPLARTLTVGVNATF